MVEFRSKFDSSTTAALNKNSFKRLWWLFVLLSVVFILIGVVGIAFGEDEADLVYGIIMLSFGVLFTPLVWGLTKILQKRLDKSMSIMSADTEAVFLFDENKITIEQIKGEEYYAKTVMNYGCLYKVTEDRDAYFLYISKMQSHVVQKSALTRGTLKELNYLLLTNLGDKFKIK